MSDFELYKRRFPSKEKFFSSLMGIELVIKSMNLF